MLRSSITLCILLCVFTSCDLFKTRDPQSPSQVSSNFVPPTSATLVFDNLKNSFLDLNDVNYLKCLADTANGQSSFQFVPTATAAGVYGVFSIWGKDHEPLYFLNLRAALQAGSIPSLDLSATTSQTVFPDSVQLERTYTLNIPHTRTDLPKVVHGKMQAVVVLDRRSGFWDISRWADVAANQTDATWSDAKGVFGQ